MFPFWILSFLSSPPWHSFTKEWYLQLFLRIHKPHWDYGAFSSEDFGSLELTAVAVVGTVFSASLDDGAGSKIKEYTLEVLVNAMHSGRLGYTIGMLMRA